MSPPCGVFLRFHFFHVFFTFSSSEIWPPSGAHISRCMKSFLTQLPQIESWDGSASVTKFSAPTEHTRPGKTTIRKIRNFSSAPRRISGRGPGGCAGRLLGALLPCGRCLPVLRLRQGGDTVGCIFRCKNLRKNTEGSFFCVVLGSLLWLSLG